MQIWMHCSLQPWKLKVLAEFGKPPFELLKDEQEEGGGKCCC
jgi:hypothetical protein